MFSGLLSQPVIQVKQGQADAHVLIVTTALSLAASIKTVVVVGTDTDLRVMLVTPATTNITGTCYAARTPQLCTEFTTFHTNKH